MDIIALGSSSVQMFVPLKNYIKIVKFKGTPIKSLLNKSKHYEKIIKLLNNKNYEFIIFVFGEVDVNFYYIFKKYIDDNKNFEEEKFFKIAKDYVKFVKELKGNNKIIINVNLTYIQPKHYIDYLKKYLFDYKEIIDNIDLTAELSIEKRNKRIIEFNNIIEKDCIQNNILFIDYNKFLLTKQYNINKLFLMPCSDNNVHLFFERLLILILLKTPLNLNYLKLNITFDYIVKNCEKAISVWNDYVLTKDFSYKLNKVDFDKYKQCVKLERKLNIDKLISFIKKMK